MRRARILGTGRYVPERVVTNDELAPLLDTTDAWIVERTGIRQRHWVAAGSGVGSSELGCEAARLALDDAGVSPEQIGLILFATISPDHDFPGNALLAQRRLGLTGAVALDVRQQCTGFLWALTLGDQFIRVGQYDHVLVIAGEVQSTGLDLSKRGRDLSVIFADGAGAVVLGPSDDEARGILGSHLHSDGTQFEQLWCEFPSSRATPRLTAEAVAEGRHFPKMNGRLVFRHAAQRMPESVRETMAAHGATVDRLDLLIPHQANRRILEFVQRELKLPDDKVAINIERYGNTTGASIPIALDEARRAGRMPSGALVCLTAFGAGFSWGSILLRA